MFKFFDTVYEIFDTLFSFVVTSLGNVINAITMITKGFAAVGVVSAYVPDVLRLIFFAVVSYSVVVNVLHKGG